MARILVADDEEDMAVIIRERLEANGHQVAWASDGGVAWEMFQKNEYDLVILDVRMPVFDGFKVCEMIRGSSRPGVPVLFMSAYVKADELRKKTHGELFLEKPFRAVALLGAVQKLLQQGGSGEDKQPQDFSQN